MVSVTKLQQAALAYARHGFPVFPLRARSKKPITEHGFQDATRDDAQVQTWWTEHPHANIGIPMGAPSELLLLDLDYRNASVIESRADLIELYGEIPDTCEVITGSGGRHIYFRFRGGPVPKQIAKGVELKSDGGYSVVPPSIHPNGKPYSFDGAAGWKALLNVADPPRWLLEAIAESRAGKGPAPAESERWGEGDRNNRLTSLAGKLRRDGLGEEALAAALLAENRVRCSPPLPEDEVRRIARSVGRYEPARAAAVNLDALTPSLETLNALTIFGGKIRFLSVKSRGSMIVAGFAQDREAIWPAAKELLSFHSSQALIAEATGIVMPSPSRRTLKAIWEPTAQLILQLAGNDRVPSTDKLRDEFQQILYATWKRAGCPVATNSEEFFQILKQCVIHKREPHSEPPCCAIWHTAKSCYVHQPSLLEWLSTPVAKSKHYDWGEVQKALLLLEFKPKQEHRSHENDHVNVRVWRGPLVHLIDDETDVETTEEE